MHGLSLRKKITELNQRHHMLEIVVVFLVVGTGTALLKLTHAATPTIAVEAEAGKVAAPASVSNDSSASGGKSVHFNAPSASGGGETPPTSGPAVGKSLAFVDNFDSVTFGSGKTWGYTSTSYAYGDHNPGDHKLDWLTPSAMAVSNGVITMTATPRDGSYWNTGLLTTEPSGTGGNGFQVKAGDFLVHRVMMPTGNTGAWPALWTWRDGNGEIDVFEWHSDNPNLLELTNHIRSGSTYYTNANLVAPGKWVWIGIQLGANNDTWYVGDSLNTLQAVFSDNSGIGSEQPYIIVDLAISDGGYHPAPSGSEPIVYKIDTVRVYR